MVKRFPEISTNVRLLNLSGTAIEEVPPSIRSWPRLHDLLMSYFENLKEFPHALDSITHLELNDTEIQEVPPWIKRISRLRTLMLKGCRKVVSLPQIPESLKEIDAEDCESLEILDCTFHNPEITLRFGKCFKLNQEARDLIIQSRRAVLPGREVHAYFTHRVTGGSLTIKLNERPLPRYMRFKACILLVNNGDCEAPDRDNKWLHISFGVRSRTSGEYIYPCLTEHLYTFGIEAIVTSSELVFEFNVRGRNDWKIGGCGLRSEVLHIVDGHE
ncbi:PREDICTED: probable disease resistance protein RPP1 [Camelina sativa]|uniref:Probable disease resistance protein RPP1 n=1 Tax=Camelina sativa TaxID=90675 RepID=A0ABM0VA13_CAMSA|nr:PREDICTED: probable disease resistance protein RPP1 [Camelina sativa]